MYRTSAAVKLSLAALEVLRQLARTTQPCKDVAQCCVQLHNR